ncbi:MAG: hypothetical protein JWL83_2806 [Actinomycetia bacterium]|nr:hypothetical protein [Actinomycetes bacterium]
MSGAFHRPVPDGVARLIGLYEIALGLGAAVVGGGAAMIVAATYAAFALFALLLRRTAPDAACGCLGDRSTRVSFAHLVCAASAAAIAALYALTGGSGARTVLVHQPFGGVPLLTLVACCAAGATLFLGASNEEPSWPH